MHKNNAYKHGASVCSLASAQARRCLRVPLRSRRPALARFHQPGAVISTRGLSCV